MSFNDSVLNSQQDRYFTTLLEEGSTIDEDNILDSQNLHQYTEVSPQEFQSTAEKIYNSKKPQRGGNFTIEEDKLLVSAWLNISLDAIQGIEQKHSAYWERVHNFFHKHKNFDSNRSEGSLMNRWSAIQKAVNKFCGCYAQVESLHQSGTNEEDKLAKAKVMYRQLKQGEKGEFQFEHCWNILRHQPKWMVEHGKKNQTKRTKIIPNVSPSTQDSVTIVENDVSPDKFVELERPTGRKAEKELLKKQKNHESANLKMEGIMNEIKEDKKKIIEKKMEALDRAFEQEKEKIQIKKERLQLEQFKEDERIMMIDINGLSERQREFYLGKQLEILKKRKRD